MSIRALLLYLALTATSSTPAADWDSVLRSLPRPENIRATMQRLSARPHHIGSAYDRDNAEWILAKYKEWGIDARIESFRVLFPTPTTRVVEMIAPRKFKAALRESALDEDPTSSQQDEQLPTYNAYSIDGDVTAPLVYVNYGMPDDYITLEQNGISVKGCIVIARYGAGWRGLKPKVAAEHGAVGCLIYSDPSGDGYTEGDVFPVGPYRPADGVQRGSVLDMPVIPGDPETPGYGSTPDAPRLSRDQITTLTKIPVLPISHGDALPLLSALDGQVAPKAWRGTLPITYHVGPGEATVHLKLAFKWDHVTINDVIATIPGSTYPDEWLIRGNHYDAWVNGASDPISGQAAMLEEARCMNELVKRGWKPARTLKYCSWDGEEEGLLGSVEWIETHAAELSKNAVAYINSDGTERGFFSASGSHTLEKFINGVATDVRDPETGMSLLQRARLAAIAHASSQKERDEIRGRSTMAIPALGSGSDFSGFLDHLGIASLDLGFGGEGGGGVYHSIYDDFYWYTHFADTSFHYGCALAGVAGTAMRRLADADVLPFSFAELAATVKTYVDELQALVKTQRDDITERNKEISEGVFAATNDPHAPTRAPEIERVPPFVNFTPMLNALDTLTRAADRYAKNPYASVSAVRELNALLIASERALITQTGLPDRPWYRHQLYAPGLYTGYGVKTVPAVREAIDRKNYPRAEEEIVKVAAVIAAEADLIGRAAALRETK